MLSESGRELSCVQHRGTEDDRAPSTFSAEDLGNHPRRFVVPRRDEEPTVQLSYGIAVLRRSLHELPVDVVCEESVVRFG